MSFLQGLFGPPDVEKMKARRDVDGLIKALSYQKDRRVRWAAAEALGIIGDARAVEPLTTYVGMEAADKALVKIGGPAVPLLIIELGRGSNSIDASKVLIKIGSPAVPPLIAALNEKNAEIRFHAAEVLGELRDSRAVGPLSAALNDEDESTWMAARALGKIGSPAVESLIAALENSSAKVRKEAAEALGNLKDFRAVEPLIATLNSKAEQLHYSAVHALGKIGGPRAVEGLITALKSWDERVWRIADDELCKIGPSVVEPLLQALKDGIGYGNHIANTLDRLDWRPGQDEISALYWIAKKEWEKCMLIGVPAMGPLIATLKKGFTDSRLGAAEALGKTGNPHALEPLIAALKDDGESSVRQAAANALVNFGTPAEESLIAALKDKASEVRRAAANALEKIGWLPRQDSIGAAYWAAKQDWERCVKIGAPAVESLIFALNATLSFRTTQPLRYTPNALCPEDDMRREVAETLIDLYQSGRLDDFGKKLILQQQEKIILPYTCHSDHSDSPPGCNWSSHDDDAISVKGLDFPL